MRSLGLMGMVQTAAVGVVLLSAGWTVGAAGAQETQGRPSALEGLAGRPGDFAPLPRAVVARLAGQNRAVAALAFAKGDRLLASASWDDTVFLWSFTGGKKKLWAELPGSPSGVAFSPDGKLLVCGGEDSSVHLWDLTGEKPKELPAFSGHRQRPFAVAFSPTGKMLASGCFGPVLRIWRWADGEWERWGVLGDEKSRTQGVSSLAFSHDGQFLAAGNLLGKATLRVWKLGAYMEEVSLPATAGRLVAFSPKERRLAVVVEDGSIQVWNFEGKKPARERTLAGHPAKGLFAGTRSLAFAPDGRTLASAGTDRRVVLWDSTTGKVRREWRFPEEVKALAFAEDGRHLALGYEEGTVYLLRWAEN